MIVGSICAGDTFKFETEQGLLKWWWVNGGRIYIFHNSNAQMIFWQSKYKIMKVTSISKFKDLYTPCTDSNIQMCVVPGPASQDAVIKSVYSSPGFTVWIQ